VSAQNLDAGYVKMEEGLYWISNLYVSRALQGGGLGSAVLDTIESTATSKPLCAKVLALNAINKVDPEREEKYKALGLTIPPVRVPLQRGNVLIPSSFPTKSGMKGGAIKLISLWKNCSPELTRQGKHGIGMLCF
jgi:hypothetical protein